MHQRREIGGDEPNCAPERKLRHKSATRSALPTGVFATVPTVSPIKRCFTLSDQGYLAYTQRRANHPEACGEHERQLESELIFANDSREASHPGHAPII